MFKVVRRAQTAAPVTRTWEYLTEPALIKQWFADVERFEPGESFKFSFGDGDFFIAEVIESQEPTLLRLNWKFMGIGPMSDITYLLAPVNESETELTITDRGALTQDEAQSLNEGWADFLTRLATCLKTGEPTRFKWSETISMGAVLNSIESKGVPAKMNDERWWRSSFPTAELRFGARSIDKLALFFYEEPWEGIATEAIITTKQFDFGTYLAVTHTDWVRLPEINQITERSRYARFWSEALQDLERQYDVDANQ